MAAVVNYVRNVTTTPSGEGVAVNGLLCQAAEIGPSKANMAYAAVYTSNVPVILTRASPQTQYVYGLVAQSIFLPSL